MRLRTLNHSLASAEATPAISLPEIISAMSFALDLTEGAVHGHAVRSCLLGMRIAQEAGFATSEMFDLYYSLLMKDVGCSSNSARMCQIVAGDERVLKSRSKTADWSNRRTPELSTLHLLWKTVLPEATARERFAHIARMGRDQAKSTKALISMRCDRGANILRKLEFSESAAKAVQCLDEHWDGRGYPLGLEGEEIPRLARVLAIAQSLDVFSTGKNPQAAIQVIHMRSNTWFDPELVRVATSLHNRGALWMNCLPQDSTETSQRAVLDLSPGAHVSLRRERIDQICEAFADVVDAKSPFTFRHSMGVTEAATSIAKQMGLPSERVDFVRRGALLHDIGKLSISNAILDKHGSLTSEEFTAIKDHPVQTRKILERVSAFKELAVVAGQHHEKLDGTGYPHGLNAAQLCLESRIIAVADVYSALTEDRPYRPGLEWAKVVSIMESDLPNRMDSCCFDALMGALNNIEVPKRCRENYEHSTFEPMSVLVPVAGASALVSHPA